MYGLLAIAVSMIVGGPASPTPPSTAPPESFLGQELQWATVPTRCWVVCRSTFSGRSDDTALGTVLVFLEHHVVAYMADDYEVHRITKSTFRKDIWTLWLVDRFSGTEGKMLLRFKGRESLTMSWRIGTVWRPKRPEPSLDVGPGSFVQTCVPFTSQVALRDIQDSGVDGNLVTALRKHSEPSEKSCDNRPPIRSADNDTIDKTKARNSEKKTMITFLGQKIVKKDAPSRCWFVYRSIDSGFEGQNGAGTTFVFLENDIIAGMEDQFGVYRVTKSLLKDGTWEISLVDRADGCEGKMLMRFKGRHSLVLSTRFANSLMGPLNPSIQERYNSPISICIPFPSQAAITEIQAAGCRPNRVGGLPHATVSILLAPFIASTRGEVEADHQPTRDFSRRVLNKGEE